MPGVPSACRRIAALIAVLCLGASVPATSALAQGAGDQQYQDPFGDSGTGSDSGSSGSGSSGSSGSGQGSGIEPLSPSPQTSGSGSSSGSAGTGASGTAATPSTAPAATGSLPNTGLDTRFLLLGGAALLIVGLGLRLRSAPERF
jgi:LPXTG-motif cell wall-anchored protein